MKDIPLWVAVVTSAAVGAFVSAVINALSAWCERSARRKELLLSKAIDLAVQRQDLVLKVSERSGKKASFHDLVFLAEVYYRWLSHLLNKGKLPKEVSGRFLKHVDPEAAASKQDEVE